MTPVLRFALPACLGLSIALTGCGGDSGDTSAASESQSANAAPQSEAPGSANIRDVSVSEANGLLSSEAGAVVLDVRTPEEFDAGHIDGAVNADFLSDDFASAIAGLDRDTTYILHCKSGSRSTRALEILEREGFTSVAHLTAGYDGWKAAQETQ